MGVFLLGRVAENTGAVRKNYRKFCQEDFLNEKYRKNAQKARVAPASYAKQVTEIYPS